ncbi:MAG TPA: argininosuccinate lyase [Algoriphagus sp.]|jgi:argininosuccinate lyase|uniref:argininosuccinate lyase n=1 Tax=Algoriphagus TaxID=246875 RepID=UPI000C69208D|nr:MULTISPECIES: argininosuccinate lyase [Algoriphagus]MAL12042.1 argininosuccinate lyase [Algoriphagus sp.]QYH38543.1 argininosuccinate lyase [Algoriphagus sp. NBT04N3]HAD53158.1 argininosuccinate lyase [Algoriphagus sp.]HAH37151.1 argininosuccinate lyase [Algoriphagus sp.]HAS59161.1 argininosuccinate lyase [Algoriphagus sp.]|tara:strand:+ start:7067 stop:8401 length:1335 start_codon:yes stop_codon:yes gene_type:complete
MKIWQKATGSKKEVESFTIGRDPEFDSILAPFDVLGSMAHAAMLQKIGLLTEEENTTLQQGLKEIYFEIEKGKFKIEAGVEDVHSQVEFLLTERYGDVGKKLHSGRSRNDQVLVDLKLYYRAAIRDLVEASAELSELLLSLSKKHQSDLMPGYTHTQLAMPSSFGLWFSSFAEGISEDLSLMKAAFDLCNKNPLGSAAGYGSSFPLDRTMTSELLGFADLHHNVINAQNSRGKTERTLAFAMAGMAGTLNRMADDVCIFMNQHFGFISFPDDLTTGSSIMPHKKNPDVFELIRAKTNQIQAVPNTVSLLLTNSTTGYHRDLQLLKEEIFPAIASLQSCLEMTTFMLKSIKVQSGILKDEFYKHLFSVEVVNDLVLKGMPFRDAYKKVGLDIEKGDFSPDQNSLNHVHEGSIGNLNLTEIQEKNEKAVAQFNFEKIDEAYKKLLS